jgi:hypothetical protein
MITEVVDLDLYRLDSDTEPTQSMLDHIMHEVSETAKLRFAKARENHTNQLVELIHSLRKNEDEHPA